MVSMSPTLARIETAIPELILQNIPTGIIFCDTDCIIRFINNTYAEYLDVDPNEVIGRSITDLIPDSRLRLVMASGQAEMGDKCELPTKTGIRMIVVNRLPVKTPDGTVIGAISQSLFGDANELMQVAQRIVQLEKKVDLCKLKIDSALSAKYSLANIHGQSAAIVRAKELVRHYAKSDSPVLITGPTGTGKELFSHALHQESPRCNYPFVSINCAAIPPDLLESELFGYAPGAFTGARKQGKIGFLELADKGTLFLDEIGDMPLSAQVKVLRVLEDKVVCRVGSTKPHSVDFRLVVATNRELKEMFRNGTFREDLYYRFSAMTINVPPLTEWIEDIPILIRHLLDRMGKAHVTCSRRALGVLLSYNWPGNVRELKNVVERALSMCKDGVIDVGDLPSQFFNNPSQEAFVRKPDLNPRRSTTSLSQLREENEKMLLLTVLEENRWNIVRCAKSLSISRATLYEKLNKYQLSRNAPPAL
jgi:transcriptional regulator with PAS, ATPase and Fis domain